MPNRGLFFELKLTVAAAAASITFYTNKFKWSTYQDHQLHQLGLTVVKIKVGL